MQIGRESIAGVAAELGTIEVRMIETIAVLLLLIILRAIAGMLIRRNVSDARSRYHWGKGVSYATALVGLLVIGRIWFLGFRSVATFLGLVAAGLVITLKEPVLNMAGWIFLLWRRPFVVGDRIQIGDHAGDVIDRRLFQFSILEIGNWIDADQSTGRIIHIPNGRLFQEPLANFTRAFPYLWNEVSVPVTFESNWREAKRLLLAIAERHSLDPEQEAKILSESQHYMIFYSTLRPTVYTRGGEYGVILTVRYICGARARRGTAQAIWEDVLDAFADRGDIDFAYPTRRLFDRVAEERTLRTPAAAGEDGQ
jgi:small-conductance mechanosensitive channel